MQCLEELYLEHSGIITAKTPEIKHIDLWAEQISFLNEEHPFKAPACFLAYRAPSMEDLSLKIQKVNLQVDLYYYYETFADTSRGAKRQSMALEFLKTISKLNSCFHGTNGTYYSEMRRIGFAPVQTGTANLLYVQRYECYLIDEAAQVLSQHVEVNDVDVMHAPETLPEAITGNFEVDMG